MGHQVVERRWTICLATLTPTVHMYDRRTGGIMLQLQLVASFNFCSANLVFQRYSRLGHVPYKRMYEICRSRMLHIGWHAVPVELINQQQKALKSKLQER